MIIVMIGEALVDIKNEKSYPGGSLYNTSIAASRLGSETFYFGKISGDNYGKEIVNHLVDNFVFFEPELANCEQPSMTAEVMVTKDKNVNYKFNWKESATFSLTRAELDKYFFQNKEIGCVVIGSIALMLDPLGQVLEDFVLSLPKNIKLIIDPNVRLGFGCDMKKYRDRLLRLTKRCNLIKLSEEDLVYLFPEYKKEVAIQQFMDRGLDNLILTSGKDGSCWFNSSGETFFQQSINAKIVDTVGCGDTFLGAIIAGLDKLDYFESDVKVICEYIPFLLNYATKAATENLKKPGCDPPSTKELKFEI